MTDPILITAYARRHGIDTLLVQRWLSLAEQAPGLPEPYVFPGDPPRLQWDTTAYTVSVTPTGVAQLRWHAKHRWSLQQESGTSSSLECPRLALWLGRLCGEQGAEEW